MQDLIAILHNKWLWILLGSWYVFSAFVSSLPSPEQIGGGLKYKFLFSFLHSLAGNLNRAAIAFKVPGAE